MIVTTKETKDRLQEQFKCGRSFISMALNFKVNSIKARKLRQSAMRYRGSYFIPTVET